MKTLLALTFSVAVAGGAFAQTATVTVAHVTGRPLPTTPDASAWGNVPEAKLSLVAQNFVPPVGGGTVGEVRLRAVHDGERMALRLEWSDPSADRSVGVDRFRDSVAVGFPLGEAEPPPSPFMGDAKHPVAIWQWTADLAASAAGQGAFERDYPYVDGIWYFPQDTDVRRRVHAWRGTDPVIEYTAAGFGTLERRESRNVRAVSHHDGKGWSVVLLRTLATGDSEDAGFKPGERTRLIVAVWDGAEAEVNGRKSVTLQWVPFEIESTLASAKGGQP